MAGESGVDETGIRCHPTPVCSVWLIPGASLLAALIAAILALRQSGQAWTALAVLLPVAALIVYSIHRRKVVLENGVLRVPAGPHTAKVPVALLDLGAARVVDLDERKEFRPGCVHSASARRA